MLNSLDKNKMPNHIAFIIDGNGRWAKLRGLKRTLGHKKGVETVKDTIDNCIEYGIKVVSFYVFSTENWSRPKEEIDEIFRLLNEFFEKYSQKFIDGGIKLMHSGDLSKLDKFTQNNIISLENETKSNSKITVNICINYGSRQEIVKAVNELINDGKKNIKIEDLEKYLYTKDIPNPDLIIRTSGEQRLSNFMLFQSAYSEFYFPKIYWPEFDKLALEEALINYQNRSRRYGNI